MVRVAAPTNLDGSTTWVVGKSGERRAWTWGWVSRNAPSSPGGLTEPTIPATVMTRMPAVTSSSRVRLNRCSQDWVSGRLGFVVRRWSAGRTFWKWIHPA